MRILLGCRKIIGLGIFACIVIFVLSLIGGNPSTDSLPTLAVLPSLTWTPEAVAIIATDTPGVTIIPTVVRASSGFVTITPAPGTIYPTATVTDTPLPTATNTDLPTPSPAPQITPMEIAIYYAVSTVNLRSCPRKNCSVVEQLPAGSPMGVSGTIDGDAIDPGNTVWYKVEHSETDEYAYSRLLSASPPVQVQQQQSPVQQQVPPPATIDPSNGATAKCNDGSYSYAEHHQGACSGHKGVAIFYK